LAINIAGSGSQSVAGNASIAINSINKIKNVRGGTGDDTITGDSGDNILDGGSGNRTLRGGGGRDTYRFGLVAGDSTISLNAAGAADLTPTIEVGPAFDRITVFHNFAPLNLFGGEGDDFFDVRAFPLAISTDGGLNPQGGRDAVQHVLNGPVNIVGGGGVNSMRVVGTEFSEQSVRRDCDIIGIGGCSNKKFYSIH